MGWMGIMGPAVFRMLAVFMGPVAFIACIRTIVFHDVLPSFFILNLTQR
jgi:hypothetical protein